MLTLCHQRVLLSAKMNSSHSQRAKGAAKLLEKGSSGEQLVVKNNRSSLNYSWSLKKRQAWSGNKTCSSENTSETELARFN